MGVGGNQKNQGGLVPFFACKTVVCLSNELVKLMAKWSQRTPR